MSVDIYDRGHQITIADKKSEQKRRNINQRVLRCYCSISLLSNFNILTNAALAQCCDCVSLQCEVTISVFNCQ